MTSRKLTPLTPAEVAAAREQGWQLCDVWCSTKRRAVREILPADMSAPFRTDRIFQFVWLKAKANDKVAQRALALLMEA